jgi:hypothetical protein
MIEPIQTVNYEPYIITNSTQSGSTNTSEACTEVFDIQEILNDLNDYTYSENDIEYIDASLVSGLKKKFNIEEEDIYKLRGNGYDLERLYLEDGAAYLSVQSTQNTEGAHVISNVTNTSSKVAQIGEKIEVIKKQNDNMYLYALHANEPITINSLYQSHFKGSFKKTSQTYTNEDISKVLQMNGLSDTKGNRWAANKLAEYGMDINKQDVVKLQNMQAAVQCLDKQEEMEKAEQDIEAGKEAGERPLMEEDKVLYGAEDIKELKEELGRVEEGVIEELVERDEEITIGNLRATLFKNTDLALKRNKALSFTEGQKQAVKDIKEQINQIRAKLTTEAAQKISEKMPLESSQLTDVVQELKAIESQTVEAAAKQADVELTPENVEVIRSVMAVRQGIAENREGALELQVQTQENIKLNEIHEALSKYEQNETPVEARFGETIKKVENQIESLLQEMGIDPSKEAVQAAKALIINNMEVSEESIKETLQIMTKINTFIEEMTPYRTAVLIKEGLNPYHAAIDTILDWVSKDKVEDLKSSIAETIVALQEKGQVTVEQKDALLGFYRIMQSVSRNREEVVGYLFKNDLPLTVERLDEATKYIGSQKVIETAVGDSFGEIEELKYNAQTAKMLLNEGTEQTSKTIDIVTMLENMELSVTPENIEKLKKINALLYPLIKEQFKKELGKFEGMSTLPKSFLEKLDHIKKMDPQVISHMLKQGITPTVSNLYWTDKMLQNPEVYKELLQEGGLIQKELPQTFDEMEETLVQQEQEAKTNKEAALENGDMPGYKTYKQIQEVVHLQKELSQKDGIYQIPFMIQGEEKMVHLYFNKKQNQAVSGDQSTTAVMTYETKHLGTITAYIHFKEENISYKIQGETSEITSALQNNSQFLDHLLNNIGYLVNFSEYEARAEQGEDIHKSLQLKRGESDFEEVV